MLSMIVATTKGRKDQLGTSSMGEGNSVSYSQDSSSERTRRDQQHGRCDDSYTTDGKHEKKFRFSPARRDHRLSPSERSNSGIGHKSDSTDKRCEERYKHHKGSSINHTERRGHSGSESSHCCHHSRKDARRHEPDDHKGGSNNRIGRKGHSGSESSHSRNDSRKDARRDEPDALVSRHKYNNHLDSTSAGRKPSTKETDLCHDSRPSKHGVKHNNDGRAG
ncbi:hypothetical protein LIER_01350 [Lithospermum erythrorhizon]|uniref:Uncharacterized protein n=1 Tax=Lithospermum erythrorhizon TaxID=34254 RepID=A0AAV3NLC3_LITER